MRNACEALLDRPGERRVVVSTSVVDDSVRLEVRDSVVFIAPIAAEREEP